MAGYRASSCQFHKSSSVLSKDFEIEIEMIICAVENMLVENVIIEYRDRPEGSKSKFNMYSDEVKILVTIACLYKNSKPFHFLKFRHCSYC